MSGCILVVEDQMDNRQILRDLLGSAGRPFGRDGCDDASFLRLWAARRRGHLSRRSRSKRRSAQKFLEWVF